MYFSAVLSSLLNSTANLAAFSQSSCCNPTALLQHSWSYETCVAARCGICKLANSVGQSLAAGVPAMPYYIIVVRKTMWGLHNASAVSSLIGQCTAVNHCTVAQHLA
jgi:hypothetical protein